MYKSKLMILQNLLLGLLVVATLVTGTGTAQADVVTYNSSPASLGGKTDGALSVGTFSFLQFDSNLGTLNSVSLYFSNQFSWEFKVHNMGNAGNSGTQTLSQGLDIKDSGGNVIFHDSNTQSWTTTIANAYDGLGFIDFSGSSSATTGLLYAATNSSATQYTVTGMDPFIGTGSLSYTVFAPATSTTQWNNAVAMNSSFFNASGAVTYDYTPTVVPEPVSSTLFIIGGATLGFRRLRNMKKV